MVALCATVPAWADDAPRIETGYNTYGYPGLIDMPVATSRPDGELALTASHFAGQTRTTLTFQMTPRLSGSFRYAVIDNFDGRRTRYDRSFSVHYRFVDETDLRPAVAVGLNDFLGTGIYSSEYFAATKTLGDSVRVTGGIGWGRLGGVGGFTNPLSIFSDRLETRPDRDAGQGGDVESSEFFRGDAALFGGIQWQATDSLRFTAEYSSDNYPREDPFNFRRKSQLNFGATYMVGPLTALSVQYLYGSELGVQLSTALNPKFPPNHSGRDPAPPPVLARDAPSVAALGWTGHIDERNELDENLASALAAQGVNLHGFSIASDTVRVEIENTTYHQTAQAVGRTARVLTRLLPAHVEIFDIALVNIGLPVTEIRIRRADLETLEHDLDGSWTSFARARISSPDAPTAPRPDRYPSFEWTLGPYLAQSLFDPDDPVRADLGAQLNLSYQPMAGFELFASMRQKVVGTLDEATRKSDSVLPRVRSDFTLYDKQGETAITNLTAANYFKAGRDFYGRMTAGYLERMFGGLSAEMLWKRNDSPFALGVDVNYVKQRDFDGGFGFRDFEVATGHASAYWNMGNGFFAQVDAGRYLAKDWGATFALDRAFGNGWRIGAFATFTDVSFDTFGEGSFDKGIRLTVPISWLTGEPNRIAYSTTIRPVLRDGGARLDVPGRLFDRVQPLQKPALQSGWGRFWR